MLAVGIVAVVLWVISMWRRGGQYTGKIHWIPAIAGVVASFGACVLLTNLAVEYRVVSNYFGNVAFAYQDYGFPYCFTASVFNTGISEPSGYSEKVMNEIGENGALNTNETGRSEQDLPKLSSCSWNPW